MTNLIWSKVCFTFPFLDGKGFGTETMEDEGGYEGFDLIKQENLCAFIEELAINLIENEMREKIAPEFWKNFNNRENEVDGFNKFKTAVRDLYNSVTLLLPVFRKLERLRDYCGVCKVTYGEETLYGTFKVIVGATLHSQLSLGHKVVTEDFYRIAFKVFCNPEKSGGETLPQSMACQSSELRVLGLILDMAEKFIIGSHPPPHPHIYSSPMASLVLTDSSQLTSDSQHLDQDEDEVQCGGCSQELEQCHCDEIMATFNETNRKLIELDILEKLAGDVITALIHVRIENRVQEMCNASFSCSYISSLENWLDTVVLGWLSKVYMYSPVQDITHQAINKFKQKLLHHLYETYTCTRIDQMFNIIIEYPDSQPAVEDLRVCVQKTDLRGYLTRKLEQTLVTKLLHQGVNTPDVLTAYVAAVKTLRQLDPTGVLLDTVTQPVRKYLRNRHDTVRCVVTALTDEGPSELADELVRCQVQNVDENSPLEDNIDNWESWEPDPMDADPSKTAKSRQSSDIISMLANVYGSKETFVTEYRTLLADRLLSSISYNTEKELRYLELLKLRFGEGHLHYCEVMLKDIYDSKRINGHLTSDLNFDLIRKQEFPTTALILSAQFWPAFKEETLELPQIVKDHFQIYTEAFEMLKGNRTLNWKPHLGFVTIDIELKDRKISLSVSPIHATIIWHFQGVQRPGKQLKKAFPMRIVVYVSLVACQERLEWTIEDLSHQMQVPATVLRRKIAFWQSQGLLREVSTDMFVLVEDTPGGRCKDSMTVDMSCEDEESDSPMASAHDQREEELQVFWSYIVGMLTNLDSMPLDRIHQMLKMFASQGPMSVECNVQELRHFLDRKVREHKLLFSGGLYRLPKT
ncbi:unnamed protein product [Timema podura]|uniref:Anaphase-promoting complex subunit 2 n=1 Tax=Timema podura TaxID=61482 RepID=A0ABN7NE71_TIMPD|nr:unnamed protein product [Timema podura]